MKLEEAIKYLRSGKRIYRESCEEYGLKWNCEVSEVEQSYCIDIYDLLAEDWQVKEAIE